MNKTIKRNGSWDKIISEQFSVKDKNRRAWMAAYAQKHDLFEKRMLQPTMIGESLSTGMNTPAAAYGSNMAATPGNTMGMGNFGAPMMAPGDGGLVAGGMSNTGGFNSLMNQVGGSGDIIMQSTVPVALWVAANTVGLDLVGVVNANGPVQQFQFLDFPYAGGKFGRNNEIATLDGIGEGAMEKPSYVKFYAEKLIKDMHVGYVVSAIMVDENKNKTKVYFTTPNKVTADNETIANAIVYPDAAKILLEAFDEKGVTLENKKIEKVLSDAPSNPKGAKAVTAVLATGSFIQVTDGGAVFVVDKEAKTIIGTNGGRLNLTKTESEFGKGAILQVVKPTRQGDALICKTIQVTGTDENIEKCGKTWNDGNIQLVEGETTLYNTSFGLLQNAIQQKKSIFTPIFDLVATGDQRIVGYTSFSEEDEETEHGFGRRPMSRGENETGTGNIIGARTFQKWIEMDSSEIQGTVTRQQVQDMKVYGIDVVGRILDQMANELTQEINTQILTKVWRLGRMNHDNLKKYQGFDLDLNVNVPEGTTKDFTDYMRYGDKQRRIQSRILAAINVISSLGRYGRPNWIVTNVTVATALQDSVQYEAAPIENEISQMADMYMIGNFAGLQVYVDPLMDITRNQVLVGRRTSGECPGVIFIPYILAETVSIIAEGTMANKMLMNSRYAVAEVGFDPASQYYAFKIEGEII